MGLILPLRLSYFPGMNDFFFSQAFPHVQRLLSFCPNLHQGTVLRMDARSKDAVIALGIYFLGAVNGLGSGGTKLVLIRRIHLLKAAFHSES